MAGHGRGVSTSCGLASLLMTVTVTGVDVGDRWLDAFEVCRPHLDDHILVFNDLHLLMGCLGAGKEESVQHLMDSIETFIK